MFPRNAIDKKSDCFTNYALLKSAFDFINKQ